MSTIKNIGVILIFSLFSYGAFAQRGKLYDADKQLSSNYVSQVYQDHDGYIWVATHDGVNRYDGYHFMTIKKENPRFSNLASNYINCVYRDKKGTLYLGLFGGLQTYDEHEIHDVTIKDGNILLESCYITCFLERRNGELLVGTSANGILRMVDDRKAMSVHGLLHKTTSVTNMMEDSRNRLWLVTPNQGVICIDNNQSRSYFTDHAHNNMVRDVREDLQGNIYVATFNDGLYVMTAADHQFHQIPALGHRRIVSLLVKKDGTLLIGQDGTGISYYYPMTGTIIDNPIYSNEVDLSHAKVYSIIEDKNHNIWLGLLQKGLFMQPHQQFSFCSMGSKNANTNVIGFNCVLSTLIDHQGHIWIGTDQDGIYELNEHYQLVRHYTNGVPTNILTIAEDEEGNIWIGSFMQDCGYLEKGSRSFHRLSLPNNITINVFSIVIRDGMAWLGTMGYGLISYDIKTGKSRQYLKKDIAVGNNQYNALINDYIQCLELSADNKKLYVGTTMGICCLDIVHHSWTSVFHKNTLKYGVAINCIRESGDYLYYGTNNGLYAYNLHTRQLRRYSNANGICNNGIESIEIDGNQTLWLSTLHGLCQFKPSSLTTHNYFVDNGLQNNEFSVGASCSDRNGNMLFGGTGGITWFNPRHIHTQKWKSKVEITQLRINDRIVSPHEKSGVFTITDTTLMASQHFDLCYDDNSFTFNFSTLTYDDPEHITYKYQVNSEGWIALSPGSNELSFSHMSPGTYHIRVLAQRNDQTTAVKDFTVTVHNPWYRSLLAKFIYLLLLIALVRWYILYRRHKEQENLQLQEHLHAEQMSEAKIKFFMNISHDIRTPMTLILTPLLSLMKEDTDPKRHLSYDIIKRNAERILHLVNQMMDSRKIDKGLMMLKMSETNLIKFVDDIYQLFSHQAKAKHITFVFLHEEEDLKVWIDRSNFDKIIMNLLSNAFKYTHTGGTITIKVSHDENLAYMAIKDNGEGIAEEHLDKIFQRFYQTASNVNSHNPGTGIGLDLTQSLVELHHGSIRVHNNTDQSGCEFIVTIPLGNAHLKAEEMLTDAELQEKNKKNQLEWEEDETENISTVKSSTPTTEPHKRKVIAIVEDDYEIQEFLKNELIGQYEVETYSNGKEALYRLLNSVPDLVITDVMMPEMDGMTLCRKLKTNINTNSVPVIMLTAKSRDEDMIEGLESGADAYIQKPFNLDILIRNIVNLLNSRRLMQMKYSGTESQEDKVEPLSMKSPDEKLMDRIMKTLNANISNPGLNVEMLASAVGVSRVHLHRKMKELTGQTPHDFISNIRLRQAGNLLKNNHNSIQEVMFACGFSNSTTFSTIFKNFYGMSPREYMRQQDE